MRAEPFTIRELAVRIGRSVDWLYRNLDTLQGLPAPLCPRGKRTWDRAEMEAWLRRRSTLMPAPANDVVPIAPRDDQEWKEFLRKTYREPANSA